MLGQHKDEAKNVLNSLELQKMTRLVSSFPNRISKNRYSKGVKLLSVVTITFHDSEGLRSTRDSLALDLVDWIVIDGSTSEEFKAENRKILKGLQCELLQEQDHGRFDAMNKGLRLVKTDLVTFLNSGDKHANLNVPRQMLSSFKTHGWDWAVGQTICVDSEGNQSWNWPMPNENSLKFRLSIRSFSHQATVYRSEFIREMQGYYNDSLYSDWVLSLKMCQYSKPYIHSKIWCHFLGGGISGNQTIKYWSRECIRLRRLYKLEIGENRFIDSFLQHFAGLLIRIDRGKMLMRPDLVQKYKVVADQD